MTYALAHVNGLCIPSNVQIPPVTGRILPQTSPSAGKTSTHWNNHPTNTASSGQIPQSLEENARKSTSQRADPSTDWRKTDKTIPSKCPDSSSEWKKLPAKPPKQHAIRAYHTRIFAGAAIVEHVIHGMRTVFAEFKARWLARQFYVGTPRRRRT